MPRVAIESDGEVVAYGVVVEGAQVAKGLEPIPREVGQLGGARRGRDGGACVLREGRAPYCEARVGDWIVEPCVAPLHVLGKRGARHDSRRADGDGEGLDIDLQDERCG